MLVRGAGEDSSRAEFHDRQRRPELEQRLRRLLWLELLTDDDRHLLEVPTATVAWPSASRPRRAASSREGQNIGR